MIYCKEEISSVRIKGEQEMWWCNRHAIHSYGSGHRTTTRLGAGSI